MKLLTSLGIFLCVLLHLKHLKKHMFGNKEIVALSYKVAELTLQGLSHHDTESHQKIKQQSITSQHEANKAGFLGVRPVQ